MAATHEETVAVACLHCKVPAGTWCRSKTGHYDKGWYAHNVRHLAYEEYISPVNKVTITVKLDKVVDEAGMKVDLQGVDLILCKHGVVSIDLPS